MRQSEWSWEAQMFEKIDARGIKAEHAAEAWHVAIDTEDRAWGYRIAIPDDAKIFILWRVSVEVAWVNGSISPGIAFFNGGEGIALQYDQKRTRGELRHVMHTLQTKRIASYKAPNVEPPFKMTIELNAVTKKVMGMINDYRVFNVKMPFRGLPDFDVISDVEILSTTPPNSNGGTASYSTLRLQCE